MVRDGAHRVTPSSSSARFRATRGEPMSIAAVVQTGARCRQTAKAILSPEQTEPSVQSAEYKLERIYAMHMLVQRAQAFADATRLRILLRLLEGEATVSDIVTR